jgi:hypothetical protein
MRSEEEVLAMRESPSDVDRAGYQGDDERQGGRDLRRGMVLQETYT